MPRVVVLVCLLLGLLLGCCDAYDLNASNLESLADGKSSFIMFRAPWCGHCKSMKPDWDRLEADFKDSDKFLIGHVDCTTQKDMCQQHGIEGFPTLKYGDVMNLQDYKGDRVYEKLKEFADKKLGPHCGPANPNLCDEAQRNMLDEFMALSKAEVDERVLGFEGQVAGAEKSFKEGVDALQAQYQELIKAKDKTTADIKLHGMGMLKAVRAYKEKQEKGQKAPPQAKAEL